MIGQTIAHYRIVERLGGGGMGVVYRAEDLKLGREVALKFLAEAIASNPQALERFTREARSAAALSHPHISTIYEIGEYDGQRYIAMELLEGQTLQQRIGGVALPLDLTLEIGAQVADALAAAHEKGIVHRDVKPGNVFLTSSGLTKVVDFGLAKPTQVPTVADSGEETRLAPHHVTAQGSAVGTVAYMSPEQARGEELDARTDIFSLGVVLYEMATGRQAFGGTTTAVVFDGILNRTPEAPSHINHDVPPELEGIIARAIEKDRNQRYQSAAELAHDLKRLRKLSDGDQLATPSAGRRGHSSGWGGAASRRPAWRRYWPAAAVLLAIGAGIVAFNQFRRVEALGESDVIVLTDFTNTTGDPVFDGTLKQALAVKLEESPFLNVLSQQRVQQTLQFMKQPPDAAITPEIGREICQRQGVEALMAGEIARLGETYVVTLSAEHCASGDVLAREQVEARSKEAVLSALGRAATAMRGKLGESLASIERMDKPIGQATTTSLEALKAFSLGDRERAMRGDFEALSFYKRAVELDPEFALAHARLGTVYGNLGDTDLATTHRKKAFELADKVSERERLYITAHYYMSVERDIAKAADIYELWKRTYPRDTVPYTNLGLIYQERGDDERALASYLEAITREPRMAVPYTNAAAVYIQQGRFDEAETLLKRYLSAGGESASVHAMLYTLAAVDNDEAAMERHAAPLRGTPNQVQLLEEQARMALTMGKVEEFRRLTSEMAEVASRYGMSQIAPMTAAQNALVDALLGYRDRARREAREALGQPPSEKVALAAIRALALVGEVDDAERAYAALREAAPKSPLSDQDDRVLRAMAALGRGRTNEALDLLAPITPDVPKKADALGVCLLRGRALLASERPADAEREFQKVIDHHQLSPLDIVRHLSIIGLAEARMAQRNLAGAKAAFETLFELWKDADTDLPVLKQARAAYARISST